MVITSINISMRKNISPISIRNVIANKVYVASTDIS